MSDRDTRERIRAAAAAGGGLEAQRAQSASCRVGDPDLLPATWILSNEQHGVEVELVCECGHQETRWGPWQVGFLGLRLEG